MTERLTDEALADLLAKAKAAQAVTPGPWAYLPELDTEERGWVDDANGRSLNRDYDGQWEANAAQHAAAAHPATVAALVREVQAARTRERIGRQMANACYNLGQPERAFTDADRETLARLAREWDDATAAPASPPAAPAPRSPGRSD